MLHSYGYPSFVYVLGGLCAVAALCLVIAIVVALVIASKKRDDK